MGRTKYKSKISLTIAMLLLIVAILSVLLVYSHKSDFPPIENDAIYTIYGTYVMTGIPAFSHTPPLLMVFAIDTTGLGTVYLSNESLGGYYNLLETNEPNIPVNSRVRAYGIIWHREDVGGTVRTLLEYYSIEVI